MESAVLVGHNSRVPAGWLVESVGQVVFASSKSRFPRSRRSATIAASVPRPQFSRRHQPDEYRNRRNPRKNTASQGFHDSMRYTIFRPVFIIWQDNAIMALRNFLNSIFSTACFCDLYFCRQRPFSPSDRPNHAALPWRGHLERPGQ